MYFGTAAPNVIKRMNFRYTMLLPSEQNPCVVRKQVGPFFGTGPECFCSSPVWDGAVVQYGMEKQRHGVM